MSLITSGFLKKPLKKLSKAADEIANGNLDCVINYQSTNELGKTVKSFNHMSRRLKTLTEERNRIAKRNDCRACTRFANSVDLGKGIC